MDNKNNKKELQEIRVKKKLNKCWSWKIPRGLNNLKISKHHPLRMILVMQIHLSTISQPFQKFIMYPQETLHLIFRTQ